MDASLKRRASLDALAPDPKRLIGELPDENTPLDSDSASDCDSDSDSDSHSDSYSYSYSPPPKLDYFTRQRGFGILTINVENESKLKLMATEIFRSIERAVENPEHLKTLAAQVKNMLKCPMFLQACVEAYDEDVFLLEGIQRFRNAEDDQERFENLKKDTEFKNILQDTGSTEEVIGRVLKIIMAYWIDEDLYDDLVKAIKIYEMKKYPERAKPAKRKVDSPVTIDNFMGIDYPATIEGLKDVLHTKYDGYIYELLCDSVDSNKTEIERKFWPHTPTDRLTWILLVWGHHDFIVNIAGCGIRQILD